MFLAAALVEHPTELRADLQRYYSLNLDDLGTHYTAFHAAACAACLPLGSSLMSAINPTASWSTEAYLLRGIWQSVIGKEIPLPWETKQNKIETEGLPLDEFIKWYEQDFKEVEGWQKAIL